MQATKEIQQSLTGLKLGPPQIHLNLALFPLVGEGNATPGYLLLDEALERDLAHVTEVSAQGRVPELAFENGSAERILLVDGDEMVGAKQNRILNLTILVGGGRKLVIPVSCVEQGRWAYRSRGFRSARRTLFSKARAAKMRHVTESLVVNGDRRANQAEVWAAVADKMEFYQMESPTLAMSDVYDGSAERLAAYANAFRPEPNQRGAVVAIDGKPVGVEVFDCPTTFARYLERLVGSYALDALETAANAALVPSDGEVRAFLDSIAAVPCERFAALGEGEDIRLTGSGIAGGALAVEGRLVHLAAFAAA
jgi:hypothetical protein